MGVSFWSLSPRSSSYISYSKLMKDGMTFLAWNLSLRQKPVVLLVGKIHSPPFQKPYESHNSFPCWSCFSLFISFLLFILLFIHDRWHTGSSSLIRDQTHPLCSGSSPPPPPPLNPWTTREVPSYI